jgi:hypothetical protein
MTGQLRQGAGIFAFPGLLARRVQLGMEVLGQMAVVPLSVLHAGQVVIANRLVQPAVEEVE